jgi:hypothetical protein
VLARTDQNEFNCPNTRCCPRVKLENTVFLLIKQHLTGYSRSINFLAALINLVHGCGFFAFSREGVKIPIPKYALSPKTRSNSSSLAFSKQRPTVTSASLAS